MGAGQVAIIEAFVVTGRKLDGIRAGKNHLGRANGSGSGGAGFCNRPRHCARGLLSPRTGGRRWDDSGAISIEGDAELRLCAAHGMECAGFGWDSSVIDPGEAGWRLEENGSLRAAV